MIEASGGEVLYETLAQEILVKNGAVRGVHISGGKVVPGLSSMIEVKEAATPLTNWRYTFNTEGAIYGFEQSMDNAFMKRIDNRTPIKGLYLASAWGNPGGGYPVALMGGESTF